MLTTNISKGDVDMSLVQPIRDAKKIKEILDYLRRYKSKRDYLLFLMGINCGLRVSDLLQLKVRDVMTNTTVIKEQKTDKIREIFWPDSIYPQIREYIKGRDPEEPLFPSRKRDENGRLQPIKRVQAWKILNEAARAVGLDDLGTHTMRKTYGYHYYKRHRDIVYLMQVYNHSSQAITLRYIGLARDEMEQKARSFALGV